MKRKDSDSVDDDRRVYKLVLTGGPCGGKTTGQAQLSSFFENLGWKILRVPETANVLLSGGIKFAELTKAEVATFQKNLCKSLVSIEQTFIDVSKSATKNVLIISDRGFMDSAAYIESDDWKRLLKDGNWDEMKMRDDRYNQVIHMTTAADGAEAFYTTQDHSSRTEDAKQARDLDKKIKCAWVGHPSFDVIDNSTNFEEKVNRLIERVCQRVGIDTSDRFQKTSRKVKFLVTIPLPSDDKFPTFQEFTIVHHFLYSNGQGSEVRVRKRRQNNQWSYTHTTRHPNIHGQSIELKTQLSSREFLMMLQHKDEAHHSVRMKRRCFLIDNHYFQLSMYEKPHQGLMILETFTSLEGDQLNAILPEFLFNEEPQNVTGDPEYFMLNLSRKIEPSKR